MSFKYKYTCKPPCLPHPTAISGVSGTPQWERPQIDFSHGILVWFHLTINYMAVKTRIEIQTRQKSLNSPAVA